MAHYTIGKRKRKIAPFGTQEAATLAAAGINAAASLTAAGISAKAQTEGAKQQADAVMKNATQQAEALKLQSENNNTLQQSKIEAEQQMNDQIADVQKGIQMDLQMLAGKQTENERNEAAKIQVRNGGSLAKKTNRLANSYPFQVTDGGSAEAISVNPDGTGLYEIKGDDHKHYHKTKDGSYKSGVGIKFPNGTTIEAEGNQNTADGEKLYITPDDAKFISKHTLAGFNPAKAVDLGMHPQDAYNIQEKIKAMKGITDSGKKAATGAEVKHPYGNYGGAWINTAGNLGGALIGGIANRISGNQITRANNKAAELMANAYRNMTTIDDDFITKDQYRAAHAMAVLRAPIVNTETQRTAAQRSQQRRLENADRYSASGAAANNRKSMVETDYIDQVNQIEDQANKIREEIRQGNAERATNVANANADRDTQTIKDYNESKLTLNMYNNDINNAKIAGEAQQYADALTQNAGIRAQLRTDSANKISNAISTSANAFADTYSTIAKNKSDFMNTIAELDTNKKVDSLILKGDKQTAYRYWKSMEGSDNPNTISMRRQLGEAFGFEGDMKLDNKKNKNKNNTTISNEPGIFQRLFNTKRNKLTLDYNYEAPDTNLTSSDVFNDSYRINKLRNPNLTYGETYVNPEYNTGWGTIGRAPNRIPDATYNPNILSANDIFNKSVGRNIRQRLKDFTSNIFNRNR